MKHFRKSIFVIFALISTVASNSFGLCSELGDSIEASFCESLEQKTIVTNGCESSAELAVINYHKMPTSWALGKIQVVGVEVIQEDTSYIVEYKDVVEDGTELNYSSTYMKVYVSAGPKSCHAVDVEEKPVVPVYTMPEKPNQKMVEVTCNDQTHLLPSVAADTYELFINVSEAFGYKIEVFSKDIKKTLKLTVESDESSLYENEVYGSSVSYDRGNVNLYCEINLGNQISDI